MASTAATPDLRLLTDPEAHQAYLRQHGPPDRDYFAGLAEALAQAARLDPAPLRPLAALLRERALAGGDGFSLALAERACGNLAFLASDYAAAVQHYRTALTLLSQEHEIERGRTYSSLLHPLVMLGKLEESLEAADAARACFNRAGDRHRLARLDINLASVWFRQDQFANALDAIERAQSGLQAARAGAGAAGDDHEAWAALLVTRAVTLINLARFDEAEQAYDEARVYARAHSLAALAAQADYNIGYLHFLRGRFVTAIRALDRARETAAASGDKLHLALCDLDQADVCIELHLYEDALRLAHAAWEQFQAQSLPYEQGKSLSNMAVAQQFLGHDSAALDLLEQAEDAFTAASNPFWIHMTHLYRGVILLRMGRCFEALRLAAGARAFFARGSATTKTIYATLLLAQAHARSRDLPAAEAALAEAQAALQGRYAPWLQTQAWVLAGELAEARGERANALDAYAQATAAVEVTGGYINFDELRISLLRDKSLIYERYLALLLAQPEPPAEHIWHQMERARSRTLAQVAAGGFGSLQPRGEGSRVVSEINRLREELNWYYRRLSTDDPEGAGARGVDTVLRAIQQREQELLRAIRGLPDDHYRLLEREAEVDFDQVASALDGATLVEYFPLRSGLAAVVGGASGLHAMALPGARSAVEGALRLFRYQVDQRALENTHLGGRHPALRHAAESHLRLLYDLLLAPLEPWLGGGALVIIPHGMLHALPFPALHDSHGALVERSRVSLAPSAALLLHACRRPHSPFAQRLAVAALPERVPALLELWRGSGTQVLTGAEATLEEFRLQAGRSAVVHIATANAKRDPAADAGGLTLADGRLNVIDVFNLRLQADRVLLTGCGTALGDLSRGEERLGLARAFLFAGARCVLTTLWELGDQATAEFLHCFQQHLHAGAAEALRHAQVEIRRRHAHPYYWAAFQLHGAPAA